MNSKGFTLVELAIVPLIVGLLIGATLAGQELIISGKNKIANNTSAGYGKINLNLQVKI